MVFDPGEFMKVHRAGGKLPTGGTGDLWPFHKYYSLPRVMARWGATPMAFSDGEAWRKPRHALQKDFFATDEAAAYLPAINAVVDEAVHELPAWTSSGDELQSFTCRLTFELICAVMLGIRPGGFFFNEPSQAELDLGAGSRSNFERGTALHMAKDRSL